MSDQFTPFLLHEATFALFRVDADDEPVAEVYLGGCSEKCTLDGERKEVRLEYPGVAHGRIHHADETHTIVLENLWLHEQSEVGARMPSLRRNARYCLTIVWQDEEALVWNKRVYRGVTVQPARVEESMQTLRFAAEEMFEFTGTGIAPADTAALPGVVRYVDGAQTVDLYYFDFASRTYSALLAEDLALIDFTVLGECTISIGGTVALHATAGVVRVTELVATGGTFIDEDPRLEWYRGTSRVASLSQSGILAVADLLEQAAAPDVALDFEHRNTGWLFSLANARAYAPEFAETL